MSALPTDGYRLTGISPKAWEHPADKAASAALDQIPYLDSVIRKLLGIYGGALRAQLLGNGLRLNEVQLPQVHTLHRASYVTLDWEPIPPVYLREMPSPNAFAFGVDAPTVVMGSKLMELLEGDGEALRAVFAHEAGHVVSDHMLYRTVTMIMMSLFQRARLPLVMLPIFYGLMEWSRASELTCDRAAALITRDPMAICRTLMVVGAGVRAERLNFDEFLRQGAEYTDGPKGVHRLQRMLSDLGATHPAGAKRIKELMTWVQSGEYDRIVGGDYPTRDQEFRPGDMAGEAAEHYGEKFSQAFKDLQSGLGEAGDQAQETGQKVADWLRGQANKRNGA